MSSAVQTYSPTVSESPLRILVVEDNEDVGEMLCLLLEGWGHTTELRRDGETGLEAALNQDFDLLILDLGLPRLDGFEVARRIRAERGPGPLVVALTGYTQPEHVEKTRAVGFDHHLSKPVSDTTLQKLLRIATRKRAADLTSSGEFECDALTPRG